MHTPEEIADMTSEIVILSNDNTATSREVENLERCGEAYAEECENLYAEIRHNDRRIAELRALVGSRQ